MSDLLLLCITACAARQDLNLSTLLTAQAALMPPLAALSAATGGKSIVCTEVGWASRPWTYAYRAGVPDWIARTVSLPVLSGMHAPVPLSILYSPGTPRLDSEDCSVWDQCVSGAAQALAYEAFLEVRRIRGTVTHFVSLHLPSSLLSDVLRPAVVWWSHLLDMASGSNLRRRL